MSAGRYLDRVHASLILCIDLDRGGLLPRKCVYCVDKCFFLFNSSLLKPPLLSSKFLSRRGTHFAEQKEIESRPS